jgi:hypothetical protein
MALSSLGLVTRPEAARSSSLRASPVTKSISSLSRTWALDHGQAAAAFGGDLVDDGQRLGQLGQPRILQQRAAPGREPVHGRVVVLKLDEGPLVLKECLQWPSQS